ncbi:MAG: hypothetical protein KDC10_11590, partial [Calditrichaeota bacterium]|nr:hypothetical protein [Calditrichota bacterium]
MPIKTLEMAFQFTSKGDLMANFHTMPESLPVEVGQAILALKQQFQADLAAMEARFTQALNEVLNQKATAGTAVDETARDFARKLHIRTKDLHYRTKRIEGLLGLPSDPNVPLDGPPLTVKRRSPIRDQQGKVVDPLVPIISTRLNKSGLTVEQLA